MLEVWEITDRQERLEITAEILYQLPDWFGIPEATANYVKECANFDFWVVFDGIRPVGFIALKQHFAAAAELYVLGVLQDYHRQGVGRQLLAAVEKHCQEQGIRFLQVKTLDPAKENVCYDRTRSYYLAMGFTPLETFLTLWDAGTPCLQMIKLIEQINGMNEMQE